MCIRDRRLTDKRGEEKKRGFVTAAIGGPDWGYFSFEVPAEYQQAGYRLHEMCIRDRSGAGTVIPVGGRVTVLLVSNPLSSMAASGKVSAGQRRIFDPSSRVGSRCKVLSSKNIQEKDRITPRALVKAALNDVANFLAGVWELFRDRRKTFRQS